MDGKDNAITGHETEWRVEETPLLYLCGNADTDDTNLKIIKRTFSQQAQAVFKAGLAVWRHYHAQPNCNVNASLYDIREHFQGRDEKGKMNVKSSDENYNEMIGDLRASLKTLARKIEPKVYEHGFLRD